MRLVSFPKELVYYLSIYLRELELSASLIASRFTDLDPNQKEQLEYINVPLDE